MTTGPHVDQISRDRLDDFALTDADIIISANGAMHSEAVKAYSGVTNRRCQPFAAAASGNYHRIASGGDHR